MLNAFWIVLGALGSLAVVLFLLGIRRLRSWRLRVRKVGHLLLQDRVEEADALASSTLEEAESVLRKNDPMLLHLVHALARTRGRKGQTEEEEHLLKRALSMQHDRFRPDAVGTSQLLQLLAKNLETQGRLLEAGGVARQALDVAEGSMGTSDPRLGDLHLGVAGLELALGELDRAEHHYQRALEIISPMATPGDPLIKEVRIGLTRISEARSSVDQIPPGVEGQDRPLVN